MLFAIREGDTEKIQRQAHEREYSAWRRYLADEDYEQICGALRKYIEGRDVLTSSWIPGGDWQQTEFQPIYVAVGEDWERAALFFGLIVWDVMMHHRYAWSFGRYPQRVGDIIGLTYFRIQ